MPLKSISIWSLRPVAALPKQGASSLRWSSSSTQPGKTRAKNEPFRMAVVGSGPAGFYTAFRVMGRIPGAKIDMYESLPVPYGLVRYGVAPDHPEVKNCQERFEEIALSPNFTFIGNTTIGASPSSDSSSHYTVPLATLLQNYDSVLFSYGASQDKTLGIPGESTLRGIHSAREFVGWYNGLPECANLQPDLTCGEDAVVIGQGNVAMDVARMLLEDVDVLRKTDISEKALETLSRSKVKRVHVVGRRGPMQAAFTIKEVRELMKLNQVGFHPAERTLIPEDIKSLPRASRRIMEVLLKGSATSVPESTRSWSLDSCLSPKHFLGREDNPSAVASTEFDITELESPYDPQSKVSPTGKTTVLASDVVFRSVGYKSTPLDGFAEAGIQFDERKGIIDNDGYGRVTRMVSHQGGEDVRTKQIPGLYCAGWVKRGPTGVIASTMLDAFTTGDAIVEDWLSGAPGLSSQEVHGWVGVKSQSGTGASHATHWSHWQKIDAAEREEGQKRGKEREKMDSVGRMLAVL